MSSILAIVSRAIFDKQARVGGRLCEPGEVWVVDRYTSGSKALTPLTGGAGDLYLATVRPPDERLWLVAVLERPSFDGAAWVASANVAPITDITGLIPQLRFANGAGLQHVPGKLGMTLQTPRLLADDDAALLRAAVGASAGASPGAEAAPVRAEPAALAAANPEPEGAVLSEKTDAELKKLLAQVRRAPAKTLKGVKALAKRLGATAEALAVLDAGAEALLASGAASSAGEAFSAARALERKLKLAPEPAAQLEQYASFLAVGALEVKELVAWLKLLKRAKGSRPPLERLRELVGGVVVGEALPTVELIEALRALEPSLVEAALRSWLERGGPWLSEVEVEVWDALAEGAAWIGGAAAARRRVLAALPRTSYRRSPLPWARFLRASGCLDALAAEEPPAFVLWCAERLLRYLPWGPLDAARLQGLAETLAPLVAALRDNNLALSVRKDVPAWVQRTIEGLGSGALTPEALEPAVDRVWHGELLAPEVLEALLALDAPLALPEGPLPGPCSVPRPVVGLGGAYRGLERVGAHPTLGPALLRSWIDAIWATDDHAEWIGEGLEDALTRPGCAGIFPALEARVQRLAAQGTLGELSAAAEALEHACRAAVLQARPALAEALLAIDLARLLQRQLQLGLMDEWGWPAQEEANARLGFDVAFFDTGGNFPWLVLWDDEARRVVVAGPEGVVFDQGYAPVGEQGLRGARYVDGDVLLINWRQEASWVLEPLNPPVRCQLYSQQATDPWSEGGIVLQSGRLLRRGERTLDHTFSPRYYYIWSDGSCFYRASQQSALRVDGHGTSEYSALSGESREVDVCRVLDPATGREGSFGLPPWMAARLKEPIEAVLTGSSFIFPVPPRAARSPLGARDGLGGLVTWVSADGELHSERIDGRSFVGRPGGHEVRALMTFPEREGVYPIVQRAFDVGIYAPDGETLLIPTEDQRLGAWWSGVPQPLDMRWWHLLEPRDRAGSVSLKNCSYDQSLAICAAAAEAHGAGAGATGEAPDEVLDYGDMEVVVKAPRGRRDPLLAWPGVAAVVEEVLVEVTHPRLRAGITGVAMIAASLGDRLKRLHERIEAAEAQRSGASTLRSQDVRALGDVLGFDLGLWWNRPRDPLGQQLVDVAAFLFDEAPPLPVEAQPRTRTPVATKFPWHLLIPELGGVLWRLLASGTPDDKRAQLVAALELLGSTPLGARLDAVRYVELRFSAPPLLGVDREHPDRLVEWESRYFMRLLREGHPIREQDFAALEFARDGVFRAPPGARVLREVPGPSPEVLRSALALLRARGPITCPSGLAARLAAATGLLEPSAALLFAAAVSPWDSVRRVRAALGLGADEAQAGADEVRRFALGEVYTAAMPPDPASLYAPLEPDADGIAPVDRLAEAWNARFGRRPPLQTEVVLQARADLRADLKTLDIDLRVIETPEHRATTAHDAVWVLRPWPAFDAAARRFSSFRVPAGWPKLASMGEEEAWPDVEAAFSGYVLRRFLRYLAWVHLEIPIGHAMQRGAGRTVTRIRQALSHPDLLILGGCIDLSLSQHADPTALTDLNKFIDNLTGEPYRAADGGASAHGLDRGDRIVTWPPVERNGVFLAVRPARLGTLAARARLLAELGVEGGYRVVRYGGHALTASDDLSHLLLWWTPGFQALADALESPPGEPGGAMADPRVAAPALVAEAEATLGLDADAATLYLQAIALAEPTPKRVQRANGWTGARMQRALDVLLRQGLLVQGRYDRAERSFFAPGPVVGLPSPAAPLEAAKLPLYAPDGQAVEAWTPPFGVVLPVRPMGEVFAEAWRGRHS